MYCVVLIVGYVAPLVLVRIVVFDGFVTPFHTSNNFRLCPDLLLYLLVSLGFLVGRLLSFRSLLLVENIKEK